MKTLWIELNPFVLSVIRHILPLHNSNIKYRHNFNNRHCLSYRHSHSHHSHEWFYIVYTFVVVLVFTHCDLLLTFIVIYIKCCMYVCGCCCYNFCLLNLDKSVPSLFIQTSSWGKMGGWVSELQKGFYMIVFKHSNLLVACLRAGAGIFLEGIKSGTRYHSKKQQTNKLLSNTKCIRMWKGIKI